MCAHFWGHFYARLGILSESPLTILIRVMCHVNVTGLIIYHNPLLIPKAIDFELPRTMRAPIKFRSVIIFSLLNFEFVFHFVRRNGTANKRTTARFF